MPNQEEVTNPVTSVTYDDTQSDLTRIVLPNWELMQAVSQIKALNSLFT